MIGIINYNTGNIESVCNTLTKLGQSFKIINSPSEIDQVKKIILPGVGSANFAMQELDKLGFTATLKKTQKPILGICLGMQILASYSEEGETECLGIIEGEVKRFRSLKVPQIGWNKVSFDKESKLLEGIKSDEYFYFVNSYFFEANSSFILATTSYGIDFPSIVQKDNFYGVQFHPEKSAELGLKLLNNFCTKC